MSWKLLMVCWAPELFGSDLDFCICYQPQHRDLPQLSSSPMGKIVLLFFY